MRVSWVAENWRIARNCPYLASAYTRHDMALSWASEDFSWQQPAPPDCHIFVMVEPLLFVCDCLFIRESPAYFAANLYI